MLINKSILKGKCSNPRTQEDIAQKRGAKQVPSERRRYIRDLQNAGVRVVCVESFKSRLKRWFYENLSPTELLI